MRNPFGILGGGGGIALLRPAGVPRTGNTLTAGAGTGHQWYRGTTALSGETARLYDLVEADEGAIVSVFYFANGAPQLERVSARAEIVPTITITQQPTIGALTEGAVPGDVVVTAPTGTVSSGGAATVSGPEYRRGGTGTGATGWDDPAGAGWESAVARANDLVRVRYTLTDPAGRAAPVYAYAQTTVQAVPDVATAAPEFTGTVLTALGSTEPVSTPEAPVFTGTVLTQE